MRMVWKLLVAAAFSLCVFAAHAVPAADARGALFALSDGKGTVTLLWVPPPGAWPAAWQVSDESGRVLVREIARGDAYTAAALAQLDEKSRAVVRDFDVARTRAETPDARMQGYVAAAMRVLVDPGFARAMAASVSLSGLPAGEHRYTVSALDAAGRTTGLSLNSAAVDATRATPPPPAPLALSVRSVNGGAALSWRLPSASREMPVYAHAVEAVQGGKTRVVDERLFANTLRQPSQPNLVDRDAPREAEVEYRVYALGPAGLRSAPASVKAFVEDISARVPPVQVKAGVEPGVVTLRWPAPANPNTRGAVVERAQMVSGPWQVMTPAALTTASWRDENALAGATWYYRVRFMGPRGDLGEGSVPVSARAIGRSAPPAVTGLVAEPGRTRITLHWDVSPLPVAGYRIERALDNGNWAAVAGVLSREPRFDDDFPGGTEGITAHYRVAAVAFDEQQGAFAEIAATLPDIVPPPAPRIMDADAQPGRVVLTVATPGLHDGDSLLLLRAADAQQQGLVLGDARPAGPALLDESATPGATFWYRVVALDAAGNRSTLSPPVMVRVPLAEIPVAPAPVAVFSAEPLPHVKVTHALAPPHLKTVVQWRPGADAWRALAGPVAGGGSAVQVNVPRGVALAYRVLWVDAAGNEGEPSAVVTLPPVAP